MAGRKHEQVEFSLKTSCKDICGHCLCWVLQNWVAKWLDSGQICKMTFQAMVSQRCSIQSFITTPSLSPTVVQIKQVLIGWVEEDESRGGSDPGFNGSATGEFVTGFSWNLTSAKCLDRRKCATFFSRILNLLFYAWHCFVEGSRTPFVEFSTHFSLPTHPPLPSSLPGPQTGSVKHFTRGSAPPMKALHTTLLNTANIFFRL